MGPSRRQSARSHRAKAVSPRGITIISALLIKQFGRQWHEDSQSSQSSSELMDQLCRAKGPSVWKQDCSGEAWLHLRLQMTPENTSEHSSKGFSFHSTHVSWPAAGKLLWSSLIKNVVCKVNCVERIRMYKGYPNVLQKIWTQMQHREQGCHC